MVTIQQIEEMQRRIREQQARAREMMQCALQCSDKEIGQFVYDTERKDVEELERHYNYFENDKRYLLSLQAREK